jgi:hypothetical protein
MYSSELTTCGGCVSRSLYWAVNSSKSNTRDSATVLRYVLLTSISVALVRLTRSSLRRSRKLDPVLWGSCSVQLAIVDFDEGGNGTRVARRSTNEATRFRSPFAAMRSSVVQIVQLVAFEEADGMFRLYICNKARTMSCRRATISINSTRPANFYEQRAYRLSGL